MEGGKGDGGKHTLVHTARLRTSELFMCVVQQYFPSLSLVQLSSAFPITEYTFKHS